MPDLTGQNRVLMRGAIASPEDEVRASPDHVALPGSPPNFITIPQRISAWGNVQTGTNPGYGDCVTAEEAFAKACNNPEIFITDENVIDWARRHDALNGATLISVLQYMQKDGFKQDGQKYNDGQYYKVNWKNSPTLQSAIVQGPVKIGVAASQLEGVWNGQNGWFAIGFDGDNHIDHCVSLCGYGSISWLAQRLGVSVPNGVDGNKPGYAMFTWDSIGIIDAPSMLAITNEAWLRSPTTVVTHGIAAEDPGS